MLWQSYPQQENAHLHKLDAFLKLYSQGLTSTANTALRALWRGWNNGEDMHNSWQALLEVMPELTAQAEIWCQQQAAQTNISTALVQFYLNWLESSTSKNPIPPLSGH
jgi:hypothetical protein